MSITKLTSDCRILTHTFLTWPRIPLTVRTAAPSNLAISRSDVNMSLINAVFLKILHGWPTSLIFFIIRAAWLNSRTTPVAVIRNAAWISKFQLLPKALLIIHDYEHLLYHYLVSFISKINMIYNPKKLKKNSVPRIHLLYSTFRKIS